MTETVYSRGDRIAANSKHSPSKLGRFVRYGTNGYAWIEIPNRDNNETGLYAWPIKQLSKVA